MKSSLVLITAIAAATASLSLSTNALADAQSQAAALLNPSHTSVSQEQQSSSVTLDAQAHAAALLSGVRVAREADPSAQLTQSSDARASGDAQAQAAALLSGSQSTVREEARSTATREKLGDHPAVAVAKTWNNRGIDPNAFIVAHPARLQLTATAPIESDAQLDSYSVRSGLSN
jgi:hypothetical protein